MIGNAGVASDGAQCRYRLSLCGRNRYGIALEGFVIYYAATPDSEIGTKEYPALRQEESLMLWYLLVR